MTPLPQNAAPRPGAHGPQGPVWGSESFPGGLDDSGRLGRRQTRKGEPREPQSPDLAGAMLKVDADRKGARVTTVHGGNVCREAMLRTANGVTAGETAPTSPRRSASLLKLAGSRAAQCSGGAGRYFRIRCFGGAATARRTRLRRWPSASPWSRRSRNEAMPHLPSSVPASPEAGPATAMRFHLRSRRTAAGRASLSGGPAALPFQLLWVR